MALLGIIRRWHIRDQVPLREIARRLGISRNTGRRYLRAEAIEPAYAERRSKRAIDRNAFQLSAMLKTEAARSRKQRRTLKQLHEDLKELGFQGSYDRVAAFARTWREGQFDRVNSASKRTPRPLREAGQPYGLGRGALRYWFPDLCQRISKDRALQKRLAAEIAATARATIVNEVINGLVQAGVLPVRRNVDQEIRKTRFGFGQTGGFPAISPCN